ncbi:MAG: hypothetical protein QXX09_03640, partial [Candidatus Methanomethylicia archaeon]
MEDVLSLVLTVRDEVVKIAVNGWVEDSREMPKRYFVMNCFDETVAFLGLILGAFFAGFLSPKIVLASLVNAGFAMAVSSFTVAFLVEGAEAARILELVKSRLSGGLASTFIVRLRRFNRGHVFRSAFANGFSALISTMLTSLPYLLSLYGFSTVVDAFYLSIIIVTILLLILGFLLGRIAGGRSP